MPAFSAPLEFRSGHEAFIHLAQRLRDAPAERDALARFGAAILQVLTSSDHGEAYESLLDRVQGDPALAENLKQFAKIIDLTFRADVNSMARWSRRAPRSQQIGG